MCYDYMNTCPDYVTMHINPTAVEVNLLSDFYSVSEGGCVVTVIIEVMGSSAIEIRVVLETVNGTATGTGI